MVNHPALREVLVTFGVQTIPLKISTARATPMMNAAQRQPSIQTLRETFQELKMTAGRLKTRIVQFATAHTYAVQSKVSIIHLSQPTTVRPMKTADVTAISVVARDKTG